MSTGSLMRQFRIGIGILAVALAAGACSSNEAADTPNDPDGSTSTSAPKRPDGPAAAFGDELRGGRGISLVSAASVPDLAAAGYSEAEYSVSGTATAYEADGGLPADGTYELTETGSGDFDTRVVVRRPKDASSFNGTVVVEWNNVSSGADVAPDYTYLADEIVRGGYAWVGVSAQHIGIEGGPVAVAAPGAEMTGAGKGLAAFDPERYGDLSHPGDAFSYDIFTQVGRALRGQGGSNPLGDLEVERLLAVGESQSGFALTTYANGVQPLTEAFDGFLIHSRGGAAAPLGRPDEGIDIAGTIGGEPTRIRTDLDVPTMTVQTETDVLGILNSYPARQDDSEMLRLWEIAGTAHADAFQLGEAESLLGCPQPINRGQQSFVLKAALRHLDAWAQGGAAPPTADRLSVESTADRPVYELDEVGNVLGGVRTPAVDAPVDVLSGLPADEGGIICSLMGTSGPIPDQRLATAYESRADYERAYAAAVDEAIAAGFVLDEDRSALMEEAAPDRFDR
ncbi:MAG: alpha/beta hydrolase domain-containing protein [Microthrixaceae bacterium]